MVVEESSHIRRPDIGPQSEWNLGCNLELDLSFDVLDRSSAKILSSLRQCLSVFFELRDVATSSSTIPSVNGSKICPVISAVSYSDCSAGVSFEASYDLPSLFAHLGNGTVEP